jgi:hypothetical protein
MITREERERIDPLRQTVLTPEAFHRAASVFHELCTDTEEGSLAVSDQWNPAHRRTINSTLINWFGTP